MLHTTEQGLTVFFVFLLIYVLTSIPVAGLSYGKLVAQTLIVLGLIASFRLFFRPGLKRKLTVALAVAALILLWLIHFHASFIMILSRSISLALIWVLLATEILGKVLQEGAITWHRIRGAASLYLFFGLLLADLYMLVETIVPGAFLLPRAQYRIRKCFTRRWCILVS
jgi:voltage-gated potassium channel